MDKELVTNVLIIGKSGVGKSSLLNYIFGQDKAAVGAGRPVTEKGIFVEKMKIADDFIVNVSDTWGLEADKADEWKKLINDEVKKHDCGNIAEWFHTIFYCFSAKSARVEQFEKDIIKDLIKNGNRVIVVLTNCDVNNVSNAIEEMSNELINEAGIDKTDIIKVCSVGKKLLGGKQTKTFGKEEVIAKIKMNLWGNICGKIPRILKDYKNKELESWYKRCCSIIDVHIKWYNYHSDKQFKIISEKCSSAMQESLKDIEKKFEKVIGECCNYYVLLSKHFGIIEANNRFDININSRFSYSMEFSDKLVENIATLVVNLIPLAIFVSGVAIRDAKRDEIKQAVDSFKVDTSKEMDSKIDDLCKQLEGWYKV